MHPSVPEREVSIDGSQPAIVTAEIFDRAFEGLTVDQRALLVAHHLDGRTIDDLAAELGIPIGTVKSRLFTARVALQKTLEAEG